MSEAEEEFPDLSLDNLNDGVAAEYFERMMEKVKENILDPNTPWKTKREINLKIVFAPNEERDRCNVLVTPTCKLAPVAGHVGRIALGFVQGVLTARVVTAAPQEVLPFTPNEVGKKVAGE